MTAVLSLSSHIIINLSKDSFCKETCRDINTKVNPDYGLNRKYGWSSSLGCPRKIHT